MKFESAHPDDFNEIQNLYWDLIDKSKDEPSFPDWKKGEHPSSDFLMQSITNNQLLILRDAGIIKACAIVNSISNKEYANVSWQVKEKGNNDRSELFSAHSYMIAGGQKNYIVKL